MSRGLGDVYKRQVIEDTEEALDGDFIGTCRLLIYMYLPSGLIPENVDDLYADDFIRLAATARHARHMKREDLKQGILEAFQVLLGE